MVQIFLGNLSTNAYMVGSLYIKEVICNLNIQNDQKALYSQSALHKATQSFPGGNDTCRDKSEMLLDFEKEEEKKSVRIS